MLYNEIIRTILKDKDIGINQFARMSDKTPRLISDRLNHMSNISTSKLLEMLKVLDYKIVIIPGSSPTPKNGYELTDK